MVQLMTVEELGLYLRFTRRTIYRLLKQGNIPAIKIGNKWRFNKETIDEWLHENMKGVKARILVINDEEVVRTVFKGTLEKEGHTVVTASTGAVEYGLNRSPFCHILADCYTSQGYSS